MLLQTSISFCHDSSFSNLDYLVNTTTPKCNRFFSTLVTDGVDFRTDYFDNFINDLKNGSETAILAEEDLRDVAAASFEDRFQEEFLEVPLTNGILNFRSGRSQKTGEKEFTIRTFHESFFIQKFGLTPEGLTEIPKLLSPPFDIIEYAAIFTIRKDFIYISSNTPISMKAAIFTINNFDLADKSVLMRVRHSHKIQTIDDFLPHESNIRIIKMIDLKDNTP